MDKSASGKSTPTASRFDRWGAWMLVAAVVIGTALLRVRLLPIPLERDEGEFAYGGQLILDGVAPLHYLYAMKLPGIYVAYAAILALFGQSATGVHLGLLAVNAGTIVLIFVLAKRLMSAAAAVIAAASYAVLSLSPSTLGEAAHATHFVVLFSVAGLAILVGKTTSTHVFLAGLLLGVAVLMKQPGTLFVPLALLCVYAREGTKSRLRQCAILLAGVLIPLLITGGIFAAQGLLSKAYFWTVRYAAEYGNEMSLPSGLQSIQQQFPRIPGPCAPLWVVGAVGVFLALVSKRIPSRRFLLAYPIFGLLAIMPGFYFRPHYFVLILPALALLIAVPFHVVIAAASARFTRPVVFGVMAAVAALLAASLLPMKTFLFERSPEENIEALYPYEPFGETPPGGRIHPAAFGLDRHRRDDRQ
ncbi:MAG: ArnT family glycosyltransferase [Capsulimonadaceae bacterium]